MTDRHDGWILLIVQALLLWLAVGAAAQTAPGPPTGEAQTAPPAGTAYEDGVVLTGGMGVATDGVGGQAGLWWHGGRHSVGLRTATSFEFNIFGPSSANTDVALLYGRRGSSGRNWGRIAAGPALVETLRPGGATDCGWFGCTYEDEVARTLGLAVQADGVWAFSRPFGLGISVFGNVNAEGPFFGAVLSLHLGKVGT